MAMQIENRPNKKSHLPRIVVKFQDDFKIPHFDGLEILDFLSQNHGTLWQRFLDLYPHIQMGKLFTSLTPESIIKLVNKAKILDALYQPPDLLKYHVISCPQEVNADELMSILLGLEGVELAYVQSGASNPSTGYANKNSMLSQGYLNPAPEGINAKYAWQVNGGRGEGHVRFIDIEQGWKLNHEAIVVKTLPLTGVNDNDFQEHGAAVLGVIMMKDNARGRIGITPDAQGHVISQWRPDGSPNDADAILSAIHYLNFGDIILLEAQAFYSTRNNKIWPVEIQEATFQVIRLATALGIIVIEAGGNGDLFSGIGNDLDLFSLDEKKFLNPMSPDFKDSGAIIVAAATRTVPHKRIRYSNYGNRIDCYAWGVGVETAGNYPGSSGSAIDTYTGYFNGTSSASAIIAGAAIALQSISEINLNTRLGPNQMRAILSSDVYGTPSANGRVYDKIGLMPDLKKIIDKCLGVSPVSIAVTETGNLRKASRSRPRYCPVEKQKC